MRITERRLRQLIKATLIEEQNKLDEGFLQDIKAMPVAALFTIIAAFSACTNEPVPSNSLANPQEAVSQIANQIDPAKSAHEQFMKNLESQMRAAKQSGDIEGYNAIKDFYESTKNLNAQHNTGYTIGR